MEGSGESLKSAEQSIRQTTQMNGFWGRITAFFAIIGALIFSFLPKRIAQHLDLSQVEPKIPLNHPIQIPTIFVHGFRGGLNTTEKMVEAAIDYTNQQDFLRVIVDWRGRIRYQGTWTTNENPIIQIIFEENIASMRMHSRWLELVLPTLKKRYGFKKFNAVGHSVGATALLNCLLENHDDPMFPTLNKVILVAGPFNGVIALGDIPNINQLTLSGRPMLMNMHYLYWFFHKNEFPRDAKVLNIYGNTDTGFNTDKYITVNSARSINYLLRDTASIYHEIEVHGTSGEHSVMHDDPKVLYIINNFLFNDRVVEPAGSTNPVLEDISY
ncbi:alpha/beta hydrolase [Agrilactobacillus fermenti]|uniref:alpha/beta hydrolase n=1 Tax=Agrilactobacillus fermenti TaxID=2586909 RepID=UPI001E4E1F59|nr:alpha/beta hydrolase [Agrilactobacillus fermenti]MCD2255541.1 alpha/beta hydrolase [Agrilactobacillus fermenti]